MPSPHLGRLRRRHDHAGPASPPAPLSGGRHRLALVTALAATLLLSLAGASPALASHQRGGFLSTSLDGVGHLTGELAYIQNGGCVVGQAFGMSVTVNGPGGSYSAPANLVATQCLASVATYKGTFTLDLSGAPDGTYVTTFSTCCRIGGIQNVGSGNTVLQSQVRKLTGQATGSPALNSNVASGIGVGYRYAQNLNASDPDGGALSYTSLAGTGDGPSTDVVAYSATGDVTIPATRTATMANGENWVYKVRVSDDQGDFSDRDVLLTATTANHPPQFSQLPPAGAIIVRPGQTASFQVVASDPDPTDTVTISSASLPSYVTLTQTPGNPTTATVTIAPPAFMPNQAVGINLDAQDNNGATLTASSNIQIQVGIPPVTTLGAHPAATTTDPSPSFAFTADIPTSSFECQVDAGAWIACTSPFAPAAPLADGPHVFTVRASDGGITDPTPPSWAFAVDTHVPAAPVLTAAPAPQSSSPTATFAFTGEAGATFECREDGGTWHACTSPVTLTGQPDGAHVFDVRQRSAGGATGTATTHRYAIQTAAPAAPAIVTAPAPVSQSGSVAFTGTGDHRCRVDGGDWVACTSPFTPAGLADGAHTVEIRDEDGLGNASAITTVRYTLDTRAPAAPTLTGGPAGPTVSTTATFTFEGEPGGSYQCRLDDGPWAPCSGTQTYPGLTLGRHVAAFRQVDDAGNVGAASEQEIVVGATPAGAARRVRTDVAPRTTVRGRHVSVGCRLSGGALSACTVQAWATLRGHRVLVGRGHVRSSGLATRRTQVPVVLNAAGRRLLEGALGGLPVRLETVATATGSAAVLHDAARARLFPLTRFVVPADGLFAVDSAALQAAGRRYVAPLRDGLRHVATLTCVGHTDASASARHNDALGLRRAQAVCSRVMHGAGLRAARVRSASVGERDPRATNATAAGRALNRYVDIRVTYR